LSENAELEILNQKNQKNEKNAKLKTITKNATILATIAYVFVS